MRWIDVTSGFIPQGTEVQVHPESNDIPAYGNLFWFDERGGRLFIRVRMIQPHFNAICITYRYGSQERPPAAIRRACNLMVARRILTMDFYSIKVGMGGDVSGLKETAMSEWQKEIDALLSSYQRSGAVYSMIRA